MQQRQIISSLRVLTFRTPLIRPLNFLPSRSQDCAAARITPGARGEPPDLTRYILRRRIDPSAYGGYAYVYEGELTSGARIERVAIKVLKPPNLLDSEKAKEKQLKRIRREVRVWKCLNDDNILPLLGVAYGFGGPHPALVCPWAEHGTLNHYLETHDARLFLSDRLRILFEIVAGLMYLHSSGVIHGDLSGSNILFDHRHKPRLSDFGLSNIMLELEGTSYLTSSVGGAVRWAAPELFKISEDDNVPKATTESDIYSLGSVALQVLSGKIPYYYLRQEQRVLLLLFMGHKPRRPSIDDTHWAFINRCWSSPEHRPSVVVASLAIQRFYHDSLPKPFKALVLQNDTTTPGSSRYTSASLLQLDNIAIRSDIATDISDTLSSALSSLNREEMQSVLVGALGDAMFALNKLVKAFVLWTKQDMPKAEVSDAYVGWADAMYTVLGICEALRIDVRELKGTPDDLRESLEDCLTQTFVSNESHLLLSNRLYPLILPHLVCLQRKLDIYKPFLVDYHHRRCSNYLRLMCEHINLTAGLLSLQELVDLGL
ncbi:hypothetical protein SERLADRAFT_438301 [Serpula lacrymans var. lacrymans S7.9]|uniref:Protein kinase domain-containing protein n=1 Tax=Serpula lacrymans var. lacrymans (strain S7.9) TaxID=578457 RepID=F8NXK8_SERL9|nr:uncharacterized protein SERLADRAFT_438301 [Serpula lacrymans var. lacrymans S7.9]EGO24680.1 hypothetical protein SERLADRAFT_438301 [Serpula lacrymans var. lacrymans S7.9]